MVTIPIYAILLYYNENNYLFLIYILFHYFFYCNKILLKKINKNLKNKIKFKMNNLK